MTIEKVNAYNVTCTRHGTLTAYIFARDERDVVEQLKVGGWRIGKWLVDKQEHEHICAACVAKEEHEKAGPWCDQSHWEGDGPHVGLRDGQMFCKTCDRKVVYKSPGVYC